MYLLYKFLSLISHSIEEWGGGGGGGGEYDKIKISSTELDLDFVEGFKKVVLQINSGF